MEEGDGNGDARGEGDGRGDGEGEGTADAAPEEGGNCTLVWILPWAVGVITPLRDMQGKSAPCSRASSRNCHAFPVKLQHDLPDESKG